MGAVHFSIDIGLVHAIRQVADLEVFVETGTFKGDTLASVLDLFAEIHSVDLSSELYEAACSRFSEYPNIDLVCGDSAAALTNWKPKLSNRSVLYFLDAHWCVAENSAGETSQCPLLEEIRAIGRLNDQSVLVIDDARLFLAPPPAPHESLQWPTLSELLVALCQLSSEHELMVLNDVFVFFPLDAQKALQKYAIATGVDWLDVMSKLKDYDNLRKQFVGLQCQLVEKENAITQLKTTCDQREALIQSLRVTQAKSLTVIEGHGDLDEQIDSLLGIKFQLSESGQLAADIDDYEKRQVDLALRETKLRNEWDALLLQKENDIRELEDTYDKSHVQLNVLKEQLEEKDGELSLLRQLLERNDAKTVAALATTDKLEKTMRALEKSCEMAAQAIGSSDVNLALIKSLQEKESVLQELDKAVNAYKLHFDRFNIVARYVSRTRNIGGKFNISLRHLFRPRLGRLCHHPARPLISSPLFLSMLPPESLPKISIVTPSFRQARFLTRTIESVISQNYPNLEYFVQDGGSTDGTLEVLQRHTRHLAGWASEKDDGQSQAINLGFSRTNGEIMAWLNSDDLLLPGALARVGDYFARHPEVDVVYGHRILIDEEDREIGRWVLPAHNNNVLSWADFVPQETLFWRRSIWEKAGGCIDEKYRFAMDWDLLLRFRKVGARMVRLPHFLGAFRIHEAQKTSAIINEVGQGEMSQLRWRELGYQPSHIEIKRALSGYLIAHVAQDLTYRMKHCLGLG